jgi:hypothetical protein
VDDLEDCEDDFVEFALMMDNQGFIEVRLQFILYTQDLNLHFNMLSFFSFPSFNNL